MATTIRTSDFLQKFHSISGTTIGERRKNLFLLLHQAARSKSVIDFKDLQPKTPLEESFKLETLIYFNNIDELFSLLTSENPILVHRIIKKASPSLVSALCNVTNEQLLNILSAISLNAKLKLLNKLGQHLNSQEKAEDFFKAVKDKYGSYLATKLLIACSPEFIIEFSRNSSFKFSSQQLLIILKKRPDLIVSLLEILHKHVDVVNNYKSVFVYLSRHNVPLFITLRNVYNLNEFQLGRRTTNNLIRGDKINIINNAKTYSDILKTKYIGKCLRGEDFSDFYVGLFPPLITQFKQTYEQLLLLAPSLDVLLSGFRRKYDCELWNESELVTPKILEMLPNEQRLKFLKPEHKPSEFSDDDWVCYLSTPDALASLKKRIFLTSDIKSRAKLIGLLVETCRINKDKAALLEMCNYMIKQHRNDHISVRLGFLRAIKKDFKLENLDAAHWIPINELIGIFQLNGEDFYHMDDFMIGYVECCVKNGLPVKEALVSCLKRRSFWGSWNLLTEKPAYEKVCLQTIPGILDELGDNLVDKTLAYLNAILNWNKRHSKDAFLPFNDVHIIERLKEAFNRKKAPTISLDLIVMNILRSKTIAERNTLLELYLPNMDIQKVKWCIRSDVDFLMHNLDVCINISLKCTVSTESLWLHCKLYSHLEMQQKIIDICLHALSQEVPQDDSKVIKKNALIALSYLMPTPNLLKLKYNIGPYLKNATPNRFITETIVQYCNTNRLPSMKRALFSVTNNLRETDVLQFVLQLLQIKNVHVRKVALYILFRTLEKQTIMTVLKDFISDPSNAELNKFVLSAVFKYFVKNPNEYVWNTIQLCVAALDPDDTEAYNNLVLQADKIPEGYLTRYIVFMWGLVAKLPDFYTENGIKILRVAQPHLLPQDFCEALIEQYFFSYNKNHITFYLEIQAFVCKYICSNPTKLQGYVTKVLQATGNATDLKLRSFINHFVKQLCYECIKRNKSDLLKKFALQWHTFIKPHTMFPEYVYIQLSLVKVENLGIPEIAGRIATLCTFLTKTYGSEFLYPLSQEIKRFSETHFIKGINDEETETNRYVLVQNIVKSNDFDLTSLGILLLQDHIPNLIETKSKHDALIETFEKRVEPEIRILLNDLRKA